MNKKAIHPKKSTVIAIILTLAAVIFIASGTNSQPVVVTESNTAAHFSNALEMQYAQPFIDAQELPAVAYGDALETQYAQPWLDAQNKRGVAYGNALEEQYSQSWIQDTDLAIPVTGIECHSSLEMLYACQNGYGRP